MHTTLQFVKFEDASKLDRLFRGHLDWDLIFKGNLMLRWRVALFFFFFFYLVNVHFILQKLQAKCDAMSQKEEYVINIMP